MLDHNDRVCFEIIDEVSNRLIEEGVPYNLDRELVSELQNEWIKNLELLKLEPVNRKPMDEAEVNEGSSDSYSEGEYINKLENNIGAYIVCFYTKVTRSKVKWKCNFRHGFINLDNEDMPFNNATGELIQW